MTQLMTPKLNMIIPIVVKEMHQTIEELITKEETPIIIHLNQSIYDSYKYYYIKH